MQVINLTPEVGTLSIEQGVYQYDLGIVPQNKAVTFALEIQDALISMAHYGCQSCTKGVIENGEKDGKQTVIYNSQQKGVFSKRVNIHLTNGQIVQVIFKGTTL